MVRFRCMAGEVFQRDIVAWSEKQAGEKNGGDSKRFWLLFGFWFALIALVALAVWFVSLLDCWLAGLLADLLIG